MYYLLFATFAGMSNLSSFCPMIDPSHPQELFSTTYHFKPGVGGLAYIGLGVGFIAATIFGAKFADQIYKYVRVCLRDT